MKLGTIGAILLFIFFLVIGVWLFLAAGSAIVYPNGGGIYTLPFMILGLAFLILLYLIYEWWKKRATCSASATFKEARSNTLHEKTRQLSAQLSLPKHAKKNSLMRLEKACLPSPHHFARKLGFGFFGGFVFRGKKREEPPILLCGLL